MLSFTDCGNIVFLTWGWTIFSVFNYTLEICFNAFIDHKNMFRSLVQILKLLKSYHLEVSYREIRFSRRPSWKSWFLDGNYKSCMLFPIGFEFRVLKNPQIQIFFLLSRNAGFRSLNKLTTGVTRVPVCHHMTHK